MVQSNQLGKKRLEKQDSAGEHGDDVRASSTPFSGHRPSYQHTTSQTSVPERSAEQEDVEADF